LIRSGFTAIVWLKPGGWIWRWTAWDTKASVDAPDPLPTVAEAMRAAEAALPEGRRALAAPATFPRKERARAVSAHIEPAPAQPSGRKFWWQDRD
jgi:hypothetical protein